MYSLRHRWGAAVIAALILTGLFGAGRGVPRAAAAVACRSDPVVVVDGTVVDIVSTLNTDASAVRELDYTITVPAGSLIGVTTLTVGLGFPEKVSYVFSSAQAHGTLQIAASVVTGPNVAAFPTTVQASSLLANATAAGLSNQTVTVSLGKQVML